MKRIRNVLIVLCVAVLFFTGWNKLTGRPVSFRQGVEAFAETGFEEVLCRLEVVTPLSDTYYSVSGREAFLTELAEGLGITDGFLLESFREGHTASTGFTKEGAYATTRMNWLAYESEVEGDFRVENYLRITLEIPGNVDSALYYQTLLRTLLADRGLSAEVGLELTGSSAGQLSDKAESEVCNRLLSAFDAREQESRREAGYYVVYGYSKQISDYLLLNQKKINVNIAVAYDESRNRTDISLGIPLLRKDY